jgi:hypothetical protein
VIKLKSEIKTEKSFLIKASHHFNPKINILHAVTPKKQKAFSFFPLYFLLLFLINEK